MKHPPASARSRRNGSRHGNAVVEIAVARSAMDETREPSQATSLQRNELPATGIVHASEISARTFRRSFRGLDPRSVQDWLAVVEASHAALEDELHRLRTGWDAMLTAASRVRRSPAAPGLATDPWAHLAAVTEAAQPCSDLLDLRPDRDARNAFDGQPRTRAQLRVALSRGSTLLARTEQSASILRVTNDQLRAQLIDTLLTRSP